MSLFDGLAHRLWIGLLPIAIAFQVKSQEPAGDTGRAVLEAISFLKASTVAEKWSPGINAALAERVTVFGRGLSHDVDTGVSPRLQGGGSMFVVPRLGWSCAASTTDQYIRARCALTSSDYYVDVRNLIARGDTVDVVVAAFAKRSGVALNTVIPLNAQIRVVRRGTSFHGLSLRVIVD